MVARDPYSSHRIYQLSWFELAQRNWHRPVSTDTAQDPVTAGPSVAPVQNTAPTGLTSDVASSRLQKDGPNAMPDTSDHPLRNVLAKFRAPVPWFNALAAEEASVLL